MGVAVLIRNHRAPKSTISVHLDKRKTLRKIYYNYLQEVINKKTKDKKQSDANIRHIAIIKQEAKIVFCNLSIEQHSCQSLH